MPTKKAARTKTTAKRAAPRRSRALREPPPPDAVARRRVREPVEIESGGTRDEIRQIEGDDDEEHTGSHFLPDIPWTKTARLELWRVEWNKKKAVPEFVDTGHTLERWDGSAVVRARCGGSGEGRYQVRAMGSSGRILGAYSWAIEGEPRVATAPGMGGGQTAYETPLGGVVTIANIKDPMVNLIYAVLQQQTAQQRMDSNKFLEIMERMFIAVCVRDGQTGAANGIAEMNANLMRMLFSDNEKSRTRLTQLLEENANLTKESKGKLTTKAVVTELGGAIMQHGPAMVDAVGRAWRGELPAEEAATAAKKAADAAALLAQKQLETTNANTATQSA